MIAYAKRNAAIATSVGAILASILLMIFFGAWAVSASGDAGLEGVLSGAAAGFAGAATPQSALPSATDAMNDPNGVPRLASNTQAGETPADTWWGKALLGACPLH